MKQVAALLLAHFVADYLLQSHEMAQQKSQRIDVLLAHIGIHFMVISATSFLFFNSLQAVTFAFANSVLHGVVDWNIWRSYKRYVARKPHANDFRWWEDHWFYVVIGLDQLLHTLGLVLLIWLVPTLLP